MRVQFLPPPLISSLRHNVRGYFDRAAVSEARAHRLALEALPATSSGLPPGRMSPIADASGLLSSRLRVFCADLMIPGPIALGVAAWGSRGTRASLRLCPARSTRGRE